MQTSSVEQLSRVARRELILTAVQSIDYVAYGKTMRKDLAQQFGVSEDTVAKVLQEIAVNLNGHILKL